MNTITHGKTKTAMEHLTWTELSQRKAKVGTQCAYSFITFFSSTIRKKKVGQQGFPHAFTKRGGESFAVHHGAKDLTD